MNIDIVGKSKTICKAELKFAVAFFAEYLMGTKLAKSLELDIHFEKHDMADGHCATIEVARRPRIFEIGLNPNLQRYKMLQTIAHEMVHVKQYAKGELSNDLKTAKFNGKTHSMPQTLEEYLNSPWEIEAFGRDQGLYVIYQLMLKQEKITFKRGKMYVKNKLFKLPKKS